MGGNTLMMDSTGHMCARTAGFKRPPGSSSKSCSLASLFFGPVGTATQNRSSGFAVLAVRVRVQNLVAKHLNPVSSKADLTFGYGSSLNIIVDTLSDSNLVLLPSRSISQPTMALR